MESNIPVELFRRYMSDYEASLVIAEVTKWHRQEVLKVLDTIIAGSGPIQEDILALRKQYEEGV